jgi:2-polyprenyl-6-methoxyphenol hydroxylase-like FAD-dependent oxidoreductase
MGKEAFAFEKHIPAPALLEGAIQAPNQELLIIDTAGNHIEYVPMEEQDIVSISTWSAVYEVLLRDIGRYSDAKQELVDAPRPILRTNAEVTDVEFNNGRWRISYSTNGRRRLETADILIAADGAHSAVRQVTLPDAAYEYTGRLAWRGRVPDGIVIPLELDGIPEGLLVWVKVGEEGYIVL